MELLVSGKRLEMGTCFPPWVLCFPIFPIYVCFGLSGLCCQSCLVPVVCVAAG